MLRSRRCFYLTTASTSKIHMQFSEKNETIGDKSCGSNGEITHPKLINLTASNEINNKDFKGERTQVSYLIEK